MEFIYKQKSSSYARVGDVLVSVNRAGGYKNKDSRYTLVFSFTEKAHKMVFGNVEYAIFAFEDDKIYFTSGDKRTGFKITSKERAPLRVFKATILGALKKYSCDAWIGQYNLKYCPEKKLWYINRSEKLINVDNS